MLRNWGSERSEILLKVQTIELVWTQIYLISYLFSKASLLKYNIQTKMYAGPKWKVLKSLFHKHFISNPRIKELRRPWIKEPEPQMPSWKTTILDSNLRDQFCLFLNVNK